MMVVTKYPKLEKVTALDNYVLLLQFDNNEKKFYDFKPNLKHAFYKELADETLFKNVNAVDGEIEWATGQDFCPHTLYENSIEYKGENS